MYERPGLHSRADAVRATAETMPSLPLHTTLPRERSCGAMARRLIRQALADVVADRTLQDVLSVTTELVDNALLHGRGDIVLMLDRTSGHRIRIEVVDQGSGQTPAIREQPAGGTGGWGLRIVDSLSERWGAFEGTTHVWAEVAELPG